MTIRLNYNAKTVNPNNLKTQLQEELEEIQRSVTYIKSDRRRERVLERRTERAIARHERKAIDPSLKDASRNKSDPSVEVFQGSFQQEINHEALQTNFKLSQSNKVFQDHEGKLQTQHSYTLNIWTTQDQKYPSIDKSSNILSQQEVRVDLKPGILVSAVYYGDANQDGLQDVLVKLSNGGGVLYQAEAEDTDANFY